jgi:predicted esterase
MLYLHIEQTVGYLLLTYSLQVSFSDVQEDQDEPGILKSQRYFHSLIMSEIESGIPSNRIVLGGFSQGGAMSIFSGITSERKLGGIFALSSYLLLRKKIPELAKKGANKETPIFMGQGDSDPLIRPEWGRQTAQELKKLGYTVDLKIYP